MRKETPTHMGAHLDLRHTLEAERDGLDERRFGRELKAEAHRAAEGSDGDEHGNGKRRDLVLQETEMSV